MTDAKTTLLFEHAQNVERVMGDALPKDAAVISSLTIVLYSFVIEPSSDFEAATTFVWIVLGFGVAMLALAICVIRPKFYEP